MNFLGKLEELERDYDATEAGMADPAIQGNRRELQALAKKHSQLEAVVAKFREYKRMTSDLEEARALLHSGDSEMEELAREEIDAKAPRLEEIEQEMKILLLPKDPNDEKNVIVEVRAGTGGEEAALFAADLFRMYSRLAERERWKLEVLDYNETGIGGYKEIIFRIDGHGAYSKLKFESGVHRVQRVPVTEAGGRIHTSAATVAVLPEAEEVDVEILPEDLKIDTYRSSGAGGQHVNMTDSAVRITHLPTGIIATCQDERSQIKNRARAMAYLRAKLYDLELQKQNDELASERRGQIGTGDRSERIRTYNFPQNRITDHRIGMTMYKLDQYLDGDLYSLMDAMTMAEQTERLHNIETK
mgnify:CR=1 FL=1